MLTGGLSLIHGRTGLLSIGHAGFWAVGAYTAGFVINRLAPDLLAADATAGSRLLSVAAFAAAVVCAMLAASLCGLLVGVPCLRLRGDYLAIATLGFSEIIRVVIVNAESLGGAAGMRVPAVVCVGDTRRFVFAGIAAAGAAFSLLMVRNLLSSTHGRALISIREDEVASQLLGVNVTRYKVVSFVFGAALAGLAGAVYAAYMGYLAPREFGFMKSVELLLMVVLGGIGSLTGTVLATVALYIIPEALRFAEWSVPVWSLTDAGWRRGSVELAELWMVVYAIILIVMMLLRPQGLLGSWEISRLWKKPNQRPDATG